MEFKNFEIRCKVCKSFKIDIESELEYDYDEEVCGEERFLICRDCGTTEGI